MHSTRGGTGGCSPGGSANALDYFIDAAAGFRERGSAMCDIAVALEEGRTCVPACDGPNIERPVGTSSGHNAVWHGYSPYNPRMVQKYLTIFRTVNNWTFVGSDGRTPAMRLGFARQPLDFEDILWAGERVPRLRRSRRKGIQIRV